MESILSLLTLVILMLALRALVSQFSIRSSKLVIEDIRSVNEGKSSINRAQPQLRRGSSLDHPLAAYGLFTEEERRKFERKFLLLPVIGLVVVLTLRLVLVPADSAGHIVYGLGAFAFLYLVSQRLKANRRAEYLRSLEFFLPVVMERLVMAAQAGLDILPAIKAIESEAAVNKEPTDPVTRLLSFAHSLTEAGLLFEEALNLVAEKTDCSALRHAFIHLALAHKEGGEIIAPLRELSDATQLYFQESVEEEIAKMPVKATAPLLCTFAGLMLFFLASPLVQILDFVSKNRPGG